MFYNEESGKFVLFILFSNFVSAEIAIYKHKLKASIGGTFRQMLQTSTLQSTFRFSHFYEFDVVQFSIENVQIICQKP